MILENNPFLLGRSIVAGISSLKEYLGLMDRVGGERLSVKRSRNVIAE